MNASERSVILPHDLRAACRALGRSRGSAAVAAISLALGLAVNTLLFSVANGVLHRPLPVASPHELVRVFSTDRGSGHLNVTLAEYEALTSLPDVFAGVAAHAMLPVSASVDGEPEQTTGELVTADYFDVLGIRPATGRLFSAHGHREDGWPRVVVVREGYARRRWADGRALGSTIVVNGVPLTVVGVAPASFAGTFFGLRFDLWVPAAIRDDVAPWPRSEARRYEITARLQPGVTRERAAARVEVLSRALAERAPASERERGLVVTEAAGVRPGPRAPIQAFLAMLGALMSLVLLVAGLNVSGLLAVRALERRRELAIRAALGATPRRLATLLLWEAAVLGSVGAVAAALLVAWASQAISAVPLDAGLPLRLDLAPDGSVYAFAGALGIGSGAAFGLLPAWRASRRDVVAGLGSSSPGEGLRLRHAVVVCQLTASTALVVAAGLLGRSVLHAQRAGDLGFRSGPVVVATAEPALLGYREADSVRFLDAWRRAVLREPSVASAALARFVPLSLQSDQLPVELESASGQPVRDDRTYYNVVSPGYFATLGIPLLRGRDFDEGDSAAGEGAVVANAAFVDRYWAGVEPLGRSLRLPEKSPRRRARVVGVVGTTAYREVGEASRPYLYFPSSQWPLREATVHARFRDDGTASARVLVEALHRIEPDLAATGVGPMRARMHFVTIPQGIAGLTLALAGPLAALLAGVGLYGVVAHATRLRSRELAVRRCLGATTGHVRRCVLLSSARLALMGLVPGGLAAWAGGRSLSGLLVGVTPADPATYACAAGLLGLVTLAAAWGPARRASRDDPSAVLRNS